MDHGYGTSFFSLSITGSGMIVYGAYLKDDVDIPKASMQTAIFDTIAAMLAALAIMPAVFSFGIDPVSGPSLMFLTLPEVFKQMPLGNFFALFFFISVAFAGITSLINMLEAVCESWQNRFHISRKKRFLFVELSHSSFLYVLKMEILLVNGWMLSQSILFLLQHYLEPLPFIIF